jgi:hypothetical protein
VSDFAVACLALAGLFSVAMVCAVCVVAIARGFTFRSKVGREGVELETSPPEETKPLPKRGKK